MPAKPAKPKTAQPGLFTLRSGQRTFWMSEHRVQYFLARRRYGKSRLLGGKAIQRMIRIPNHSVFFINASLRQGVENIRAQVKAWMEITKLARVAAAESGMLFTTSADNVTDPLSARPRDRDKGRGRELLAEDDVCQLYFDALTAVEKTGGINAKKLESRIYHKGGVHSRSLVVPANPDTAVGYGGDTFKDEYARWNNWREVEEAIGPIIDESPHLISWGATTPPPDDDAHPSWHFLKPPADHVFPINPEGNWYLSNAEEEEGERFPILRVDAYDAEKEVPMYSRGNGGIITVEEARRRATDRRAFDRNYLLKFMMSGGAAIAGTDIDRAMSGADGCRAVDLGAIVEEEEP